MPAQEEGVHQVPGESSGGAREPKQGPHRGAKVAQGALLSDEERLNVGKRLSVSVSDTDTDTDTDIDSVMAPESVSPQ